MRQLLFPAVIVALLCGSASTRADGAADAKALLEKAIKAHGGSDNLGKVKAVNLVVKGKFYGMGEGIDYTLNIALQKPFQQRFTVEGQGFKFSQIINKDKGWTALGDNVTELDKEAVQEAKEGLHADSISDLWPASLKDAKLDSVGEVKVNDKPALGVRVEVKGYRDVTLYFDKETHLLVKRERRGKDVQNGGGEFGEETFYSDFKEVGGVKIPHKMTIKRDGKQYVEGELTEFKPADKIDEKQFAKP
jgi:hypothetical protein